MRFEIVEDPASPGVVAGPEHDSTQVIDTDAH
jgi:hypothetical protein